MYSCVLYTCVCTYLSCMYVHLYALHLHVCMNVCASVFVRMCICTVRMHLCASVRSASLLYTCIYVHLCIVHTLACMFICMHACVCICKMFFTMQLYNNGLYHVGLYHIRLQGAILCIPCKSVLVMTVRWLYGVMYYYHMNIWTMCTCILYSHTIVCIFVQSPSVLKYLYLAMTHTVMYVLQYLYYCMCTLYHVFLYYM